MKSMANRLEQALEIAAHLEERRSDLQEAAALDAGFPVKITGMEVDIAVQHLRTMAEEVPLLEGGKPYGTVAAIFPYDAPSMMLARLAGAALISGNRLRFSFSSYIPRCAGLIAEICKPVPALEPVTGMDNRSFGGLCVNDSEVRVLFMSGAGAVGETYRSRCDAFDKLFFCRPGRNACRRCLRRRRCRRGEPIYCTPRFSERRPVLRNSQEGHHP